MSTATGYLQSAARLARDLSDRYLHIQIIVEVNGALVSGQGRHPHNSDTAVMEYLVGWIELEGARIDPLSPVVRRVANAIAEKAGLAPRAVADSKKKQGIEQP